MRALDAIRRAVTIGGVIPRWVLGLAVGALTIDALLMCGNAMFLLHDQPEAGESRHPVFSDLRWNGDNDRSWPEVWGYAKLAIASVLVAAVGAVRRAPVYLWWAGLLAILVLDDSFGLHERIGTWLVSAFGLPALFGFHPQYSAEVVAWGLLLLPIATCAFIAHRRSAGEARTDSRRLFALFVLLAAFAGVIDALVVVAQRFTPPWIYTPLVLLETTGELVVMTLVLVAAAAMLARARIPLSDRPPVLAAG